MISAVRRARIDGFDSPVDIRIEAGRIAGIAPSGDGRDGRSHPAIDAEGRAVLPGLVDAHVHLDKAYQLEALAAIGMPLGALPQALAATSAVHRSLTDDERGAAAERLLSRMVRHGTTAARVHVELGGTGSDEVRWHVELARAWSDRITLQLVAFPQHGLFRDPPASAAVAAALEHGCTVVGGCPYADEDQGRHVRHVLDLAATRGLRADFHVDFTDDPGVHDVDLIIAEANSRGLGKRAAVGHVTSLAAMAPADVERRAAALQSSGIGLISLPATDLFLSGRGADRDRPRGLAPLGQLIGAGVTVAVATNNVCNAFTPYGDGSLLQIAWLAGLVAQLGPGPGHRALLAAITTNPARMLGLDGYGIAVGSWADLVVVDTDRPELAVAGPADVVAVVHRGAVSWPADG